jgi:hypothetical protein
MTPKVLRRFDVCGQFHAAYRVQAEDSQPHYYCYDCWKARFDASLPQTKDKESSLPDSINNEKHPL